MRRNISKVLLFISITGLVGCSQETEVHKEDAPLLAETTIDETETTADRLAAEGIEVVVDLLPSAVSETREELVTHIVLHFTSNAAIDPESPYHLEDIRNTFIDYGVSTHYV